VALAYGYAYGVMRSCMPLAAVSRHRPGAAAGAVAAHGHQPDLSVWRPGSAQELVAGGTAYGPFGIILGSVLWTFPHALMILCTTLASGDARLYEAAATLGAGRWRSFCQVTLPASRYGLMIAWIVVFVLVVTDFGVPKVIGGNTQMLATDIYKQVIGQQNLSMGAVVAMLLLVPAGLAFAAERHLRARQAAAMSVRAVPLVPQPCAPLDRALLVYCSLMALALLAVMGAVLASLVSFWPYNLSLSFKHYQFDMMDGGGWASYANSLTMAVATAVVGALLSFLSAYLVAKPTGWGARASGCTPWPRCPWRCRGWRWVWAISCSSMRAAIRCTFCTAPWAFWCCARWRISSRWRTSPSSPPCSNWTPNTSAWPIPWACRSGRCCGACTCPCACLR
jgi:iron(III) transport system permease protein